MKYFESEISLRRVNLFKYNGYKTHQHVEKIVFENAEMELPYTFLAAASAPNNVLPVKIRTAIRTGIAGEKLINTEFKQDQTVTFAVRFLPYKNVIINDRTKKVFINDTEHREVKLINALERNGMSAILVDEQKVTVTDFTKANGRKFALTDVTYIVEATITNLEQFEVAFMNGLGAKSNFGYGMILLLGDH